MLLTVTSVACQQKSSCFQCRCNL